MSVQTKTKLGSLIVASAFIAGCTTVRPPELALEPNVSLAQYNALVVAPITLSPDASIDLDPKLADELAADLSAALKTKGYSVADSKSAPAGALIVQCTYVSYRPGNAAVTTGIYALSLAGAAIPGPQLPALLFGHAGDIGATVLVTLSDKSSGKVLASMVVVKEITPGPEYGSGGWTTGKHYIQQMVAEPVASAIDEKIKGA
ncbi:MAG TPA: hypothetical protein VKS22_01255 [Candidatus Binataceae bacterium]|nr:hypothetical protein [Candidatus Binataceae bacterium]